MKREEEITNAGKFKFLDLPAFASYFLFLFALTMELMRMLEYDLSSHEDEKKEEDEKEHAREVKEDRREESHDQSNRDGKETRVGASEGVQDTEYTKPSWDTEGEGILCEDTSYAYEEDGSNILLP